MGSVSILAVYPFDLFIKRAISDVDHCPWDVSKGGKKISHQSFPEGIIFDNSPEKEVFIHLIGVFTPDNRIVIFF